jgi:hypothetical protein
MLGIVAAAGVAGGLSANRKLSRSGRSVTISLRVVVSNATVLASARLGTNPLELAVG